MKVKFESKMTPTFLAVGLILLDNGPRLMGLMMVVGGLNSIMGHPVVDIIKTV